MSYFSDITENKESFIGKLKILHLALVIGQTFFMAMSIFINQESGSILPEFEQYTKYVYPIALLLISIGFTIYNKGIGKVKMIADTKEKIKKFRQYALIRWALIEAASLLCIIAYLLTAQPFLIIAAVISILICASFFPSVDRVLRDLNISENDKHILYEQP